MPVREPHEIALRTWAKRAIADLETALGQDIAVIAANQPSDASRPPKPYITQLLLTDRSQGNTPASRTTDTPEGDEYQTERIYQREGTVTFQSYGDYHRQLAKALEVATDDDELMRAAEVDGLTVAHLAAAITEPRVAIDTGFEERSSADFVFRYIETVTGRAQVIEEVIFTPTVER